jgi:translation initiation factor 1
LAADHRSRLVYSTGPGAPAGTKACPECRTAPCRCADLRTRTPAEHSVRVRRERSGRKGKTVTVAGPFYLAREEALRLAKALKQECGSGGTLKDSTDRSGSACRTIEIQGDHADRVVHRLAECGFAAKRAGG